MAIISKLTIAFAILLLLSLGLCGVAVLGGPKIPATVGGISGIGILLAFIGLLVCGVAAVIGATFTALWGKDKAPRD